MASLAVPLRCCLVLALLGVAGGCAPSPAALSSGVVHVNFTSAETCGFSNPYTVEARGCRRLDETAVMCKGFGVIDGVLFAGGCEAPAELEVLETQGTMPLSPPPGDSSERRRKEEAVATSAAAVQPEEEEPAKASAEPPPAMKKKVRSTSKRRSSKAKKKPRRKRRTPD